MTPRPTAERIFFALLILLSLAALWLAGVSPDFFTDNNVVYQGF